MSPPLQTHETWNKQLPVEPTKQKGGLFAFWSIQTGHNLATRRDFQFSMTFNFNIFLCFSTVIDKTRIVKGIVRIVDEQYEIWTWNRENIRWRQLRHT
jgi:hypothetical protein